MKMGEYDKDAPLRLETAAKIAFPDGTMGAKGLRKERDRGRLATEIIANKEYTTLAAIEEMRKLCRVQARSPASNGDTNTARLSARSVGQSPMDEGAIAQAACAASLEKLKNAFKNAVPKNTRRRPPKGKSRDFR